jgi:hypothetical protein
MPLLSLFAFERIGTRATFGVIVLLVLINLPGTQPSGYLTYDEEFYYPDSIASRGLDVIPRGNTSRDGSKAACNTPAMAF